MIFTPPSLKTVILSLTPPSPAVITTVFYKPTLSLSGKSFTWVEFNRVTPSSPTFNLPNRSPSSEWNEYLTLWGWGNRSHAYCSSRPLVRQSSGGSRHFGQGPNLWRIRAGVQFNMFPVSHVYLFVGGEGTKVCSETGWGAIAGFFPPLDAPLGLDLFIIQPQRPIRMQLAICYLDTHGMCETRCVMRMVDYTYRQRIIYNVGGRSTVIS